MEIHKPKPIHSWRELLTEIGVVVIGVSIALAAEQTVEYFHWRAQVTEAREIIANELAGNIAQATARLRTATCVEHRLDELGAILDGSAKTGNLPAVGEIGIPPRGIWRNGSWESVVASQTATHFPRQQLADITDTYKRIARNEDFSVQEIGAWNSLYAMVGPGRRLDPASEARLRDALSQARSINRLMAVLSGQMLDRVNALGLSFSPEDLARIAQARSESLQLPRAFLAGSTPLGATCAPLGKAPSHYGEGLFSAAATQFDGALKDFPDFAKGAR